MRQQPLDLGDDGADIAELALQVLLRNIRVGRPRLGHEARAGTDAQRRGGLPLAAPSATGWPIRQGVAAIRRMHRRKPLRVTLRASARYNFL